MTEIQKGTKVKMYNPQNEAIRKKNRIPAPIGRYGIISNSGKPFEYSMKYF
jgi:hypothetical protein